MSNKWQDLDVNSLPSDILVEGAWETQHEESDPMKGKWYSITVIAAGKVQSQYRIRRPEGWEPKECPTCGSTNKHVHCCKSGFCPDSWHYESIKPTHEERCETLSNDIYSAMNKYSFQSTAFQEAIMKAVDFLLKQSAG